MPGLFNDQSFFFETLRALGYAHYGGADIGEVLSTAGRIPDGDEAAWYTQWRALAERIHAEADRSAGGRHRVSARESYLRASNYYRLCEFYLRVDPTDDPLVREVGQLSVDMFACAAQLMSSPPERVRFPYEDTTLPGWWIPAESGSAHPSGGDPDGPRPTLLFHGGFDSTEEELYFSGGAAAARRGYHVLAFAGPGQGSALRDQQLLFRPDWDAVVTPAVDWLLERPDVDPDRIALMGMSFGGELAPRAAATEHRVAALIAYDGLYSFGGAVQNKVGPQIMELVRDGADTKVNALVEEFMSSNTQVRSLFRLGHVGLRRRRPRGRHPRLRPLHPRGLRATDHLSHARARRRERLWPAGRHPSSTRLSAARRPTTSSPRQKEAANTAKQARRRTCIKSSSTGSTPSSHRPRHPPRSDPIDTGKASAPAHNHA